MEFAFADDARTGDLCEELRAFIDHHLTASRRRSAGILIRRIGGRDPVRWFRKGSTPEPRRRHPGSRPARGARPVAGEDLHRGQPDGGA